MKQQVFGVCDKSNHITDEEMEEFISELKAIQEAGGIEELEIIRTNND